MYTVTIKAATPEKLRSEMINFFVEFLGLEKTGADLTPVGSTGEAASALKGKSDAQLDLDFEKRADSSDAKPKKKRGRPAKTRPVSEPAGIDAVSGDSDDSAAQDSENGGQDSFVDTDGETSGSPAGIEEQESPDQESVVAFTRSDAEQVLRRLHAKCGLPAAKAMLVKHGVSKIGALAEAKLSDFILDCEKRIAKGV